MLKRSFSTWLEDPAMSCGGIDAVVAKDVSVTDTAQESLGWQKWQRSTLTKNICRGQLHGIFFSNMPTHHCKEMRQSSNSAGSPSNFLAARLLGRACKCSRQLGHLESPPPSELLGSVNRSNVQSHKNVPFQSTADTHCLPAGI